MLDRNIFQNKNVHVIYHGNCQDGIASLWVCKEAFHSVCNPSSFTHQPGFYGKPWEDYEVPDATDVLLIADFSFKKEVISTICEQFEHVVIVDHHITAKEDLQNISRNNLTVKFDMNECGATLVWKQFFKSAPIKLLELVRDQDLYQFKMRATKATMLAFKSYGTDLEAFEKAYSDYSKQGGTVFMRDKGQTMIDYRDAVIRSIPAFKMDIVFEGEVFRVPIVSCPGMLTSEMGAYLYNKEPVPFVVIFNQKPHGYSISFRSKAGEGIDVSTIAKKFGGGGHKHAAGGFVENLALLGTFVDERD